MLWIEWLVSTSEWEICFCHIAYDGESEREGMRGGLGNTQCQERQYEREK